jgi:hypothetical protein
MLSVRRPRDRRDKGRNNGGSFDMYEFYIVEHDQYKKWRSSIKYWTRHDPKGSDGVQYLKCREAFNSFDIPISKVHASDNDRISDLIARALGESPRHYTKHEVISSLESYQDKFERLENSRRHRAFSERGSVRHLVLDDVLERIKRTPSISLRQITRGRWGLTEENLNNDRKVKESGVRTSAVLLLYWTSLSEIIGEAFWRFREHNQAYALMLRNGEDFFGFIASVNDDGTLIKAEEKDQYPRIQRPIIVLLYTDEDPHVASYVRSHFDALDKASGRYCDVLFIENPGHVNPYKYWKSILEQNLYVAWNLLGWTGTVPYNKNDAYLIADKIGISYDQIPCAVTYDRRTSSFRNVFSLGNDISTTLRGIFSGYQSRGAQGASHNLSSHRSRGYEVEDYDLNDAQEHICFLSHNKQDKDIVRRVASALHSYGIETWFDEWEILPGDKITEKIDEGLSKATSVIVFLSPNSVRSRWVKEEMHNALYQSISTEKPEVIPVLIAECEIPRLLSNYKYVDVGNDSTRIANEIRRATLKITGKPPVQPM